jgi:hypothetical protein
MDGQIRYEMVSRLQADVRAVAEAERLARMASDHRPPQRTIRSAVGLAFRLPVRA